MKTKLFAATVLAAASASAFAVGPGPLGAIDNMPIAISKTTGRKREEGMGFFMGSFSVVKLMLLGPDSVRQRRIFFRQ